MSKRSPKSVSEKLEIVLLHLEEGKSLSWLTRNQGISKDTLSNWVRKYKEAGVEGLEESKRPITRYLSNHSFLQYTVIKNKLEDFLCHNLSSH